MGTSLGQAAAPAANLFAARLSQALEASGLSLSRVRAKLAESGHSVSAATLSYWSSGRSAPTRARSHLLLEDLERVLGVERGWLADPLGARSEALMDQMIGSADMIERTLTQHGVRRDRGWHRRSVHQTAWIGADRAEKRTETTELFRAPRDGMQTWIFLVTDHAGPAICDRTSACSVRQTMEIAEGVTLFEFVLDAPLRAGESVLTSQSISYPRNGDTTSELGFGLGREVGELVLQVHFAGDMPRCFRRSYEGVDATQRMPVEAPVYLGDGIAQAVVERAPAGVHRLEWDW